jgi:hypothetical protein
MDLLVLAGMAATVLAVISALASLRRIAAASERSAEALDALAQGEPGLRASGVERGRAGDRIEP